MRFASLGSGSRGNALVVESGRTRVLIDCGFGPRNLTARLARLGLSPESLDAILVTHEHADHLGGVPACCARFGIKAYMTHGTLGAARPEAVEVEVIDSHQSFKVGELELMPFPVPHDAREPVQFVISDGLRRLGIVTDAGHVTPHMVQMLSGVDGLVIECNHDTALLEQGKYPLHLKRRISGRFGHLDNAAAADLLSRIDRGRLRHVVAAHLSQENNTPNLARVALAAVLACVPAEVEVADQLDGIGWRDLR